MRALLRILSFALLATVVASSASGQDTLKVLIVDGQNNHSAWPKTTLMMKSYLEQAGKFSVAVQRTRYTWNGKLMKDFPLNDGKRYQDQPKPQTDPDFRPAFGDYDVVLSNFGFNAAPWPEATQRDLEEYVSGGGGLVIVHAADNSFGDWLEFNRMIGLGGWGGRNHKSGPYVYLNDKGETVRDTSPGRGGSHGPRHEFQIVIRNPDHPITRGLPRAWLHAQDELYQQLRGPAENMTILATAFADEKFRGTGRHEPMIMTIDYGKGRVFHTPMGHDDTAMQCVGFITTLVRGVEWAATGDVTSAPVPDDFPKPLQSSQRPFGK